MNSKDTWIVRGGQVSALVLGAFCASGAGAATLGFASQQVFTAGSGATRMAIADLNGDGMPDLVTANWSDGTISVLVNTATPGDSAASYAAQQTFAVGSGPTSATAADVNGDGKLDLIVTNFNDKTVSVLINTTPAGSSTMSFAPQQTFAVGTFPESVASADVNGDGMPDLVVVNYGDITVSVLLNTAAPGDTTASFATQQTFMIYGEPYLVAMADLNGDGTPDLITTDYNTNNVSVLLNTTAPGATTASFAAEQTLVAGNQPNSVIAEDMDGDGKLDLVVTNEGDGTVSVYLNTTALGDTTASFADPSTFAVGGTPQEVTAVDMDGDGKLDLAVANYGDNTVSVLLNTTNTGDAAPSFAAQAIFSVGNGPVCMDDVDVNGDGKPDLAVVNTNDNTVSVLVNTTN